MHQVYDVTAKQRLQQQICTINVNARRYTVWHPGAIDSTRDGYVEQTNKYIDQKKKPLWLWSMELEHAVHLVFACCGWLVFLHRPRYIIKRTTTNMKLPTKDMSLSRWKEFQYGAAQVQEQYKTTHPTEEWRYPPSVLGRKQSARYWAA
jgi:hypothetical protein